MPTPTNPTYPQEVSDTACGTRWSQLIAAVLVPLMISSTSPAMVCAFPTRPDALRTRQANSGPVRSRLEEALAVPPGAPAPPAVTELQFAMNVAIAQAYVAGMPAGRFRQNFADVARTHPEITVASLRRMAPDDRVPFLLGAAGLTWEDLVQRVPPAIQQLLSAVYQDDAAQRPEAVAQQLAGEFNLPLERAQDIVSRVVMARAETLPPTGDLGAAANKEGAAAPAADRELHVTTERTLDELFPRGAGATQPIAVAIRHPGADTAEHMTFMANASVNRGDIVTPVFADASAEKPRARSARPASSSMSVAAAHARRSVSKAEQGAIHEYIRNMDPANFRANFRDLVMRGVMTQRELADLAGRPDARVDLLLATGVTWDQLGIRRGGMFAGEDHPSTATTVPIALSAEERSVISFPTAGWRGEFPSAAHPDGTFTPERVWLLAHGLAQYLKSLSPEERDRYRVQGLLTLDEQQRPIVTIGYDHRDQGARPRDGEPLSMQAYAEKAARILAANGIPVRLMARATATPLNILALRFYGAAAHINLTGSHNPASDGGFEFFDGRTRGLANEDLTDPIMAHVMSATAVRMAPADDPLITRMAPPIEAYAQYLREVVGIDPELITRSGVRVAVDVQFGMGVMFGEVLEALGISHASDGTPAAATAQVVLLNDSLDPQLDGRENVDVLQANLEALHRLIADGNFDFGSAFDGDGDRNANVLRTEDNATEHLDGNQTAPLLLDWTLEQEAQREAGESWDPGRLTVVRTHVSSAWLDHVAEHWGLPAGDTEARAAGVGFRLVNAQVLRASDETPARVVPMAVEENGGVASGPARVGVSRTGVIPYKDGFATALRMMMLAAQERERDASIQQRYAELKRRVPPPVIVRSNPALHVADREMAVRLKGAQGLVMQEFLQRRAALEAQLQQGPVPFPLPEGDALTLVEAKDLGKDGVKFIFADHSWLVVRASGTEPIFRIYAEAPTIAQRDAMVNWGMRIMNRWEIEGNLAGKRVVVLDGYGVLYRRDRHALGTRLRHILHQSDDVDPLALYREVIHSEAHRLVWTGQMTMEKFWESVLTRYGQEPSQENVAQLQAANIDTVTLDMPTLQYARELRRQDYQVWLLSDDSPESARAMRDALAAAGYGDVLNGTVYSHDEGVQALKADGVQGLQAVAQRAHVAPSALLLIDDAAQNAQAAVRAGFLALHQVGGASAGPEEEARLQRAQIERDAERLREAFGGDQARADQAITDRWRAMQPEDEEEAGPPRTEAIQELAARVPELRLPEALRTHAGTQAAVPLPPIQPGTTTALEALESLRVVRPELHRALFTEQGELRTSIRIMMGDHSLLSRQELSRIVLDDAQRPIIVEHRPTRMIVAQTSTTLGALLAQSGVTPMSASPIRIVQRGGVETAFNYTEAMQRRLLQPGDHVYIAEYAQIAQQPAAEPRAAYRALDPIATDDPQFLERVQAATRDAEHPQTVLVEWDMVTGPRATPGLLIALLDAQEALPAGQASALRVVVHQRPEVMYRQQHAPNGEPTHEASLMLWRGPGAPPQQTSSAAYADAHRVPSTALDALRTQFGVTVDVRDAMRSSPTGSWTQVELRISGPEAEPVRQAALAAQREPRIRAVLEAQARQQVRRELDTLAVATASATTGAERVIASVVIGPTAAEAFAHTQQQANASPVRSTIGSQDWSDALPSSAAETPTVARVVAQPAQQSHEAVSTARLLDVALAPDEQSPILVPPVMLTGQQAQLMDRYQQALERAGLAGQN